MEKNAVKKPRICDILGVEIGEEFSVVIGQDVPENTVRNQWMYVDEAGEVKGDGKDPALLNKLIVHAISHPESIVRRTKPFFTNDELAMLRVIKKAYPWSKFLFREKSSRFLSEKRGLLCLSNNQPRFMPNRETVVMATLGEHVWIPSDLFPQVPELSSIGIDSFLADAEAMVEEDGVYFIKNTVDEWNTIITGYFRTFDEAKEALKECSDWYRPKGTGRIYFQKFGADQGSKMVFEA